MLEAEQRSTDRLLAEREVLRRPRRHDPQRLRSAGGRRRARGTGWPRSSPSRCTFDEATTRATQTSTLPRRAATRVLRGGDRARQAVCCREPEFFVFSNDPDWCCGESAHRRPRTRSWRHGRSPRRPAPDEPCRHHIVANSSFSWWGAWLRERPRRDRRRAGALVPHPALRHARRDPGALAQDLISTIDPRGQRSSSGGFRRHDGLQRGAAPRRSRREHPRPVVRRLRIRGRRDGSTEGAWRSSNRYTTTPCACSPGRLGRAGALNRALEEASAPLIALMDADDVALEQARAAGRVPRRSSEHRLRGTWYTAVGETGEPLYTKTTLLRDADLKRRFLLGNPIAGPTTIVRREVFDRVGGFREEFVPSEDPDFWRRAIFEFEAANIPEVLYLYRVHHAAFRTRKGTSRNDIARRSSTTCGSDSKSRTTALARSGTCSVLRFAAHATGRRPARTSTSAHEAAFCRALFERRRLRNALTLLAALVIEAPSVTPVLGKFVRAARKLRRRKAPVSGQDAIQTGD